MKRSTIVFHTAEKEGRSKLFLHPELQKMIETYPAASYSVLVSLAGFLCWRFPEISPPGKEAEYVKPKFHSKNFPNLHVVLNANHNKWIEVVCAAVNQDNALRENEDLYLKLEVSEQYGKLLVAAGFKETTIEGKVRWQHLKPSLTELLNEDRKEVLFVSCSRYLNDRPRVHLDALYMGMYFNNERWRSMNLFENGQPSEELYQRASLIIVPGSSLAVYSNIKELRNFTNKLKQVFVTNKQVKILGVCFGCQLLAEIFDGKADKAAVGTFGQNEIETSRQTIQKLDMPFLNPLLETKYQTLAVSQFHGDEIAVLPKGFITIASSPTCQHEIVVSENARVLGIQCHPEYSSNFVLAYELMLNNYSRGVNEEEITDMEQRKLSQYDDGGAVLRQVVHLFIESCKPPTSKM